MSGHSKWSTIKHKKGAADAKRGKIFTKVIREITIAARMGGEDPAANPRLRSAISLAKSVNMPGDNIIRGIKKGAGGGKGENWENITYEGYGPNNIALIVECLTDNKNRTISSIRSIFNKNGGNLGTSNSVMYMFDRKGMIEIAKDKISEDDLTEYALESGAEDIDTEADEVFVITTEVENLQEVTGYLEEKQVTLIKSLLTLVPQNVIEVDDLKAARQVINFIELLEDDDDVQNVYSNFEISDDVMQLLG